MRNRWFFKIQIGKIICNLNFKKREKLDDLTDRSVVLFMAKNVRKIKNAQPQKSSF
jgi:hypothetical protein